MIDSKVFSLYAEYGAVGIIVILFAMMIINLIKSQKMDLIDKVVSQNRIINNNDYILFKLKM